MSKHVTRRTFLSATGATVAAAGALCALGPVGSAVAAPQPPADPDSYRVSDHLTRADFERWRGDAFQVLDDDGQVVELTLVEVVDESHLMGAEQVALGLRTPFSAALQAPLACSLNTGRYRVSHPEMGGALMLVVAQGTSADDLDATCATHHSRYGLHFN